MPLADEAVLAQVARLKGIPWEPQASDEVVRRDPHEAERRRLCGVIAARRGRPGGQRHSLSGGRRLQPGAAYYHGAHRPAGFADGQG